MFKKNLLIFILFFPVLVSAAPDNGVIANFRQLSPKQLFDTADYYYERNSFDTALICYSLIINTPIKDTDIEQQKRVIEALNVSSIIYYYLCDYRSAYEFLIRALLLCEQYGFSTHESKIYTNLGNIYYRFNKHDMARMYYLKALSLCEDSVGVVIILNNLGSTELESGQIDSAFYFLNKSLQVSRQHDDSYLYSTLNTIASLYQKDQRYDSAFYYFRLSLDNAKKNNKIEKEAENLSSLGKLYFEINKTDSALYYINVSNTIAAENNFLGILADNYLTLSKIEEAKGRTISAFKHFKEYARLRDTVFNVEKFSAINQLQRLYEISKTNQQIEQLAVEQRIKERTIHYQKIIQVITLVVLLLVSLVLLFVFIQKKRLNTAYKALMEKNLEIIGLQENSPEKQLEKYKKSALTDDKQDELLDNILKLMEDTTVTCDTDFTLDKLAELLHSNHAYVSQVINTVLNKNFRSFLNGYRIREAQRLFGELDVAKFTVESVAPMVGFKSPSAFRHAFKEITGVSPRFYVKSLQEQRNVL